jgi:endonuclease/exonuclease/phosphatase family metal-dependent hydrolase
MVTVAKHEIVDEQPSATSYLSDHYPVFAEISID